MDNVLIKKQYVVEVGDGKARIDLTDRELHVVTILMEKLAIQNKDSFKITSESGEILLDLN